MRPYFVKENTKYQEKREKDERMKHVVGGEREKKKLTAEREKRQFSHASLVVLNI